MIRRLVAVAGSVVRAYAPELALAGAAMLASVAAARIEERREGLAELRKHERLVLKSITAREAAVRALNDEIDEARRALEDLCVNRGIVERMGAPVDEHQAEQVDEHQAEQVDADRP